MGEMNTSGNTDDLWDIVKEAYIFSFPLVLMNANDGKFHQLGAGNKHEGTNKSVHLHQNVI